jgi:hypothetical protein
MSHHNASACSGFGRKPYISSVTFPIYNSSGDTAGGDGGVEDDGEVAGSGRDRWQAAAETAERRR